MYARIRNIYIYIFSLNFLPIEVSFLLNGHIAQLSFCIICIFVLPTLVMKVQWSHVPLEDTNCTQHIFLTSRHIITELQTGQVYSKIKTQDTAHHNLVHPRGQTGRWQQAACCQLLSQETMFSLILQKYYSAHLRGIHSQLCQARQKAKKVFLMTSIFFSAGRLRNWALYHSFF